MASIVTLETAPSNRSTCKITGETIGKGELRVGFLGWAGGRMVTLWQKVLPFLNTCYLDISPTNRGACKKTSQKFQKGDVRFVCSNNESKTMLSLAAAAEDLAPVLEAAGDGFSPVDFKGLEDLPADGRAAFCAAFKVDEKELAKALANRPPAEKQTPDADNKFSDGDKSLTDKKAASNGKKSQVGNKTQVGKKAPAGKADTKSPAGKKPAAKRAAPGAGKGKKGGKGADSESSAEESELDSEPESDLQESEPPSGESDEGEAVKGKATKAKSQSKGSKNQKGGKSPGKGKSPGPGVAVGKGGKKAAVKVAAEDANGKDTAAEDPPAKRHKKVRD